MSTLRNALLEWLPRGGTVPHESWESRHRWVVRILAVQCVGLVIFALVTGHGLGEALWEALPATLMAVLATSEKFGKTLRSALAAMGLMVISTGLVHLSGGYIESHFHFFVMIPIVALYESWIPFALSVSLVLVHHGVAGSLSPGSIFNHPAGQAHPWVWGGVHALAIFAACLGAVVNWKAQERLREAEARMAGRLVHQANHDPLTGLPSRALFVDRLEQALLLGEREDRTTSVLMLDMDGFKEVNDVFGHGNGDLVLIEVARRLVDRVRPHDTVTRMGGDEYAVLLVGIDAEQAEETSRRLADALGRPFDLGGVHVDLEVSIGIATGGPGDDAATVMRKADTAMYHAKEQRLGRAHFSEDNPMLVGGTGTGNRLDLLGDLRRALQEHQIVLHYQPKIDLHTGRMVGVEALARWQHPERGLLQPSAFIEMVERTNLSLQFTDEVLSMALAQTRRVDRHGARGAGGGQPVASLAPGPHPAQLGRGQPRRARRLAEHAGPRDHRDDDRQRAGGHRRDPARAPPPRRQGVPGRLRHRLLLAGLPQGPADRRAQDRPELRPAPHRRGVPGLDPGPGHRRAGAQPRSVRRGRGRGGRRPPSAGWTRCTATSRRVSTSPARCRPPSSVPGSWSAGSPRRPRSSAPTPASSPRSRPPTLSRTPTFLLSSTPSASP